MGNLCVKYYEPVMKKNEMLEISEEVELPEDMEGEVHVLMVGLDYACDTQSWAGPPPWGHGPLDTRYAFDMFKELVDMSGIASVLCLWNEQCTREGLKAAIAQVAEQCGPNDYFVFYYTGHGDQLEDTDGTEPDGMDECLCLVDENGNTDDPTMQLRREVWMRDDEFVQCVFENFMGKQTHMLFLTDCCHSGSLADFESDTRWLESEICAISIAGCQDNQTSAGTGKGGYFTRSMTQVLQDINNARYDEQGEQIEEAKYSPVAEVYNQIVSKYEENKSYGHTQNITITCTGCDPSAFPWPLQPQSYYVSTANTTHRMGY